MIYYELIGVDGNILTSTIKDSKNAEVFSGKERDNLTIGNSRNVFRLGSAGAVRLLIEDEKNIIRSSRLINEHVDVYMSMISSISRIKEEQNTLYNILLHNLITTHTKIQDEIESIASEKDLSECTDYYNQINLIQDNIRLDVGSVAESTLQIIKRTADLQAQIEGIKMLTDEVVLDLGNHNIKKVLLNIIYPFYDELGKQNIKISLHNIDEEIASENLLKFDYKILNVALHHFLNNAVKYAKPYSKIEVIFNHNDSSLIFKMISLKIEKNELKKVLELGYSGINSKELAGEGIGMFMIKKALRLLRGDFIIKPNYAIRETINQIDYIENIFVFNFPHPDIK